MDGGTASGPRLDGKRSFHQLRSLLHADQTKPWALTCRFEFKVYAGVANRKMNLIRRAPQLDLELMSFAMSCRIV